jgi:hypothetical protein
MIRVRTLINREWLISKKEGGGQKGASPFPLQVEGGNLAPIRIVVTIPGQVCPHALMGIVFAPMASRPEI